MDDAVESFRTFTGASAEVARRYLSFTENDPEQAVQLYFDSPDLASGADAQSPAPAIPTSTRPPPRASTIGREDESGVVHLDSEDEEMDDDSDTDLARAAALSRAADVEDDEAMARRIQEEFYAGGDTSGDVDADGVRAPIARRTETLVGGPDDDSYGGTDFINEAVQQQMRARMQAGSSSKFSVFFRYPTSGLIKIQAGPVFSTKDMALPRDLSGRNLLVKASADKYSHKLLEEHQIHHLRLPDLRNCSDHHSTL